MSTIPWCAPLLFYPSNIRTCKQKNFVCPNIIMKKNIYNIYCLGPGCFVRNLRIFVISQGVFPGRPFRPNVTIVGKARSLPQIGSPERSFTWVGSSLSRNHQTWLESLVQLIKKIRKLQTKQAGPRQSMLKIFFFIIDVRPNKVILFACSDIRRVEQKWSTLRYCKVLRKFVNYGLKRFIILGPGLWP